MPRPRWCCGAREVPAPRRPPSRRAARLGPLWAVVPPSRSSAPGVADPRRAGHRRAGRHRPLKQADRRAPALVGPHRGKSPSAGLRETRHLRPPRTRRRAGRPAGPLTSDAATDGPGRRLPARKVRTAADDVVGETTRAARFSRVGVGGLPHRVVDGLGRVGGLTTATWSVTAAPTTASATTAAQARSSCRPGSSGVPGCEASACSASAVAAAWSIRGLPGRPGTR